MFHIEKRKKYMTNVGRYPYTALVKGDRFYIRRNSAGGWIAEAGASGVPCTIINGKRFAARTLRQLDILLGNHARELQKLYGKAI